MKKFKIIPFVLVFILSLSANFYLIKNYDKEKLEEVKIDTAYFQQLELENQELKSSLGAISKNTANTSSVQTLVSATKIEDKAKDFIEHIYNITTDNYVDKKQSARQFMSKSLFETLYASAGIDIETIDNESKVSNVEVYQHSKDLQAFVKCTVQTKQLSTNLISEMQHAMILYFKYENGELIVEAIEPLVDMGAI